MRKRLMLLGGIGFLVPVVAAAQPPAPTSAAALFEPAIPGVAAVDLCTSHGFCQPAGISSYFYLNSSEGVHTDAQGSIYFSSGPRSDVGTCLVDGATLPVTDSHLYRLTSSG